MRGEKRRGREREEEEGGGRRRVMGEYVSDDDGLRTDQTKTKATRREDQRGTSCVGTVRVFGI